MAEGDVRAFATFYDRYAPFAYGLALRVSRSQQIAEESVQEAFLSLWQRAAAYQPEKATLLAYFLRIVHNKAVDAVRREESERRRRLAGADVREEADDDPLNELAWLTLRRQQVRAALELLSVAQREALELAYFGGLTYTEVAQRLTIPLGTAKTRIRNGIIRLRALLPRAVVTEPE